MTIKGNLTRWIKFRCLLWPEDSSNPLLRPLKEKLVLTRDFMPQALKILKHKLNVQDFQQKMGYSNK